MVQKFGKPLIWCSVTFKTVPTDSGKFAWLLRNNHFIVSYQQHFVSCLDMSIFKDFLFLSSSFSQDDASQA